MTDGKVYIHQDGSSRGEIVLSAKQWNRMLELVYLASRTADERDHDDEAGDYGAWELDLPLKEVAKRAENRRRVDRRVYNKLRGKK